MQPGQIEVQKRARSACTTLRALRGEWEDIRAETQDALTVMTNAAIEWQTSDDLTLPDGAASADVREALKRKRLEALKRARGRVDELLADCRDVRHDFAKLADVERYFASSIAQYPDAAPLFRSMRWSQFRETFSAATRTYVDDLTAKEALIERLRVLVNDGGVVPRDDALAIISAFALDVSRDDALVEEFDALILRGELGS